MPHGNLAEKGDLDGLRGRIVNVLRQATRQISHRTGWRALACRRLWPGTVQSTFARLRHRELRWTSFACWRRELAGLPSVARSLFQRAKDGTGTGIRTPVPWLRTTCPDP